jgi:hypothetical protein
MTNNLGNVVGKTTSRRVLVATGAKLAYAAPVVAASASLAGNSVMAASPPCGENVNADFSVTCDEIVAVCVPAHNESVCSQTGNIVAEFVASSGHCTAINVQFFVDGSAASGVLGPINAGQSTGQVALPTTPGTHVVGIQASGVAGTSGCGGGLLQSWSGSVAITAN